MVPEHTLPGLFHEDLQALSWSLLVYSTCLAISWVKQNEESLDPVVEVGEVRKASSAKVLRGHDHAELSHKETSQGLHEAKGEAVGVVTLSHALVVKK